MKSGDHLLETQDLTMTYDGNSFALKDCSIALSKGTICAVFGESGSGKSTLLRLIAGLERPTSGRILLNGCIVSDDTRIIPPQKRNIGFVFQDYALFPHLSVEQNIAYGLRRESRWRVADLLKLVNMAEYIRAYPSQLSGGQQQRVALARTLAVDPELLLLDEPFSNLDAALSSELRREMRSIVRTTGNTMIFITHNLVDAIDIADEVIFLQAGQVLCQRPPRELLNDGKVEMINQIVHKLREDANRIMDLLV